MTSLRVSSDQDTSLNFCEDDVLTLSKMGGLFFFFFLLKCMKHGETLAWKKKYNYFLISSWGRIRKNYLPFGVPCLVPILEKESVLNWDWQKGGSWVFLLFLVLCPSIHKTPGWFTVIFWACAYVVSKARSLGSEASFRGSTEGRVSLSQYLDGLAAPSWAQGLLQQAGMFKS